jgi:transcriptional antiterminator NusG
MAKKAREQIIPAKDESPTVIAESSEGFSPLSIAPDSEDATDESLGRSWYVVHTYSGYENKVKKNLEHRIESMGMQDQIFQVVVPTEEEVEIKEGHRRTVRKRVFPGYVLVEMVMTDDSWYVVRNTPGVTGFVGSGNKPSPLSQAEADKIFKRMEVEAPKIKVSFREGQTVRIIDGPFVDFMGAVDDVDSQKGKVRVLVSFFGRETPVELDFLQVSES